MRLAEMTLQQLQDRAAKVGRFHVAILPEGWQDLPQRPTGEGQEMELMVVDSFIAQVGEEMAQLWANSSKPQKFARAVVIRGRTMVLREKCQARILNLWYSNDSK